MDKCWKCGGRGLVPDFDCYHGRPDHSPVQCGVCKGSGYLHSNSRKLKRKDYLEIARKTIDDRNRQRNGEAR